MPSRDPRDFVTVYVGGPMNGFIEHARDTMAKLRDGSGKEIGLKIRRLMPWYVLDAAAKGFHMEEIMDLTDRAGITPWGDPVYKLEETDDPKLYKYVYIREYDPAQDDGPSSPPAPAPGS